MKIIVGLGNPGEKYTTTRHNAGFMVVDAMAKNMKQGWQMNKKFNAEMTSPQPSPSKREEEKYILLKPLTYMNKSGIAIQAVMAYYKLLPRTLGIIQKKDCDLSGVLTVIHDDIDIELGKYKISVDSRSAGHKGVQSIITHLKTKNFRRIRIGIRTELTEKMPAEKFVLQRFKEDELTIINNTVQNILQ